MQVNLSTGVPTVWQGVRSYIELLVSQTLLTTYPRMMVVMVVVNKEPEFMHWRQIHDLFHAHLPGNRASSFYVLGWHWHASLVVAPLHSQSSCAGFWRSAWESNNVSTLGCAVWQEKRKIENKWKLFSPGISMLISRRWDAVRGSVWNGQRTPWQTKESKNNKTKSSRSTSSKSNSSEQAKLEQLWVVVAGMPFWRLGVEFLQGALANVDTCQHRSLDFHQHIPWSSFDAVPDLFNRIDATATTTLPSAIHCTRSLSLRCMYSMSISFSFR